jgi:hypothetical protein
LPNALPRSLVIGLVAALVLWQAASCCACLGGATSPPLPVPSELPSKELAQALRQRLMQAKSHRGPFTIAMTDRELSSYLIGLLQSGEGEFPARDMQLAFRDGYLEVWATFIDVAPVDIPMYVRATVEAQHGALAFHIQEANAGPFTVPGAMRELISRSLSETLAELQRGLSIESVRVEPGEMTLAGEVTGPIPDLP